MKHKLQFAKCAALVVAIKGYFVEELVKVTCQFTDILKINYNNNYKLKDPDLVV